MKNIMLITGQKMCSVINEAKKIEKTLKGLGHVCDLYYFNVDNPSRTRLKRYDLAIWWTPFLPMFLSRQGRWLCSAKEHVAVSYFTIEGIVRGVRSYMGWLSWQYIVTPSNFVKANIEEMGASVKEVIPHQLSANPPIDHDFGLKWRSKLPKGKKILLYNGSQIYRKALWKLREAIDILSTRRKDFLMVFHTDKLKLKFHTSLSELRGANTLLDTSFPHLPYSQALAQMKYADIIVHPAITEGFGLPVLEALGLGKPLVCVNAYGVNEIATPKNSFMVMDVQPTTLQWNGYITFKAVDYDPTDLAYQIELALDASKKTLENKRLVGLETAKRYHNSYERFAEFL